MGRRRMQGRARSTITRSVGLLHVYIFRWLHYAIVRSHYASECRGFEDPATEVESQPSNSRPLRAYGSRNVVMMESVE